MAKYLVTGQVWLLVTHWSIFPNPLWGWIDDTSPEVDGGGFERSRASAIPVLGANAGWFAELLVDQFDLEIAQCD
jgi:hypothetical protein